MGVIDNSKGKIDHENQTNLVMIYGPPIIGIFVLGVLVIFIFLGITSHGIPFFLAFLVIILILQGFLAKWRVTKDNEENKIWAKEISAITITNEDRKRYQKWKILCLVGYCGAMIGMIAVFIPMSRFFIIGAIIMGSVSIIGMILIVAVVLTHWDDIIKSEKIAQIKQGAKKK